MNMSGYQPLPLINKFIPYATPKQGAVIAKLMSEDYYSFNRFMLNVETNTAVAVLENDDALVIIYPDGYLDIRSDKSIAIIRDF